MSLTGCDLFSGTNSSIEGDSSILHPVKIDGKWGYINGLGRIIWTPRFDDARDFSEGMAAVQVGAVWGYVPEVVRTGIAPQYQVAGRFSEGLAFVRGTGLDDLYGFVNKEGTEVIAPPRMNWPRLFQKDWQLFELTRDGDTSIAMGKKSFRGITVMRGLSQKDSQR